MQGSVTPDHVRTQLINVMAICVGLGLLFQVGHFLEHAVQFVVWLTGKYEWVVFVFCGRDTPFMTGPVNNLVLFTGSAFYPNAPLPRQMMMGVEILHLIGNSLFLITIGGAYHFMRSKWVRWALYVEGFHLCEHIALFLTANYIGKPIGISTLFGEAGALWGKEAAVGYRVSWHFAMNLLPMPFVMVAMMQEGADLMRRWFPMMRQQAT